MSEQTIELPNLFDPTPADDSAGNSPARVARDFVKWLFSFGPDFRNSPDMTNLRFWLQRQKVEIQNGDERAIVVEAQALFLKKLENSLRKQEPRPAA